MPLLGHSCVEFLISAGKDPQNYEHSREKLLPKHSEMSKECAEEFLAKKLKGAEADQRRKKRSRNE